jgi:hypothetical protein
MRYCSIPPTSILDLPDGRIVAVSGSSSAPSFHTKRLISIIDICRYLRSLPDHGKEVSAKLGLSFDAAMSELESAQMSGLLLSEEYLMRNLPKSDGARVPISSVALLTRDRPVVFDRCISSIMENCREWGHSPGFLVIDDSTTQESLRENERIARRVANTFGFSVGYANPCDRERFARETQRAGVRIEIARFACCNPLERPVSTGAVRNAILLETQGSTTISLDDDTVCNFAVLPFSVPRELTLGSIIDPTELWFPDEVQNLPMQTLDYLELHSQLLGRSLGSIVAASGSTMKVGPLTPMLMAKLGNERSRVTISTTGYVGDSGAPSPAGYLTRGGETRKRLTESVGVYQRAMRDRTILRTPRQVTISDVGITMGINLGLDLRDWMPPPFLPVQRGQDLLFSVMSNRVCDYALTGFLPAGLWHLPNTREYSQTALEGDTAGVYTAPFITYLFNLGLSPESKGKSALNRFAMELQYLGGLPKADFHDFCQVNATRYLCLQLKNLCRLLNENCNSPDYWRYDVRRMVESLETRLATAELGSIVDLGDTEDPVSAAQMVFAYFGALLDSWECIVETARAVRESDGSAFSRRCQ